MLGAYKDFPEIIRNILPKDGSGLEMLLFQTVCGATE